MSDALDDMFSGLGAVGGHRLNSLGLGTYVVEVVKFIRWVGPKGSKNAGHPQCKLEVVVREVLSSYTEEEARNMHNKFRGTTPVGQRALGGLWNAVKNAYGMKKDIKPIVTAMVPALPGILSAEEIAMLSAMEADPEADIHAAVAKILTTGEGVRAAGVKLGVIVSARDLDNGYLQTMFMTEDEVRKDAVPRATIENRGNPVEAAPDAEIPF